jgi:hypothetical protein
LPSVASAEYFVPPENSAVNQYTESVPTAGGQRDLNKGRSGGDPSPEEVLGEGNARRLESQGPVGRKVAEVVATTAPGTNVATPSGNSEESGGIAGGAGGGGGGGDHGSAIPAGQSGGSSALGEVLGQATGSSSGQMGLLLPLVILATAAWALAFSWRRRERRAP